MPSRLIPALSAACALLIVAYLAFLTATVLFATLQTDLSRSLRETQSRVGSLETRYYAAIAKLSESRGATLGLVEPARTVYVSADGTPTVTRADR